MRNIFTSLLIFISSLTFSQNYKLFNASSKKLFTDSTNAFSISFDSVKANGSDSVYHNFSRLNDTVINSDTCHYWWGAHTCNQQDKPVWAGGKIKFNNLGVYQFHNLAGDTLNFDFTKIIGDTSLMYKDATQKFLFVFEKSDTLTTLNYFDSARFYNILHTDLAGNPINSKLNGKEIVIAKNLGLVQFFQIDSFPQQLRHLYLAGNEFPTCGMFKLTDEMIYDYQPGDEIQFYNSGYYPSNSYQNYSNYVKYTFKNRIVTTDSLKYEVFRTTYDVFAGHTSTDTITLKYYRNNIVSQIPFDFFDGSVRKLYMSNYCNMKLWSYNVKPQLSAGYCSIDNCWGPVDTGGPPPESSTTYVTGLGIYYWDSRIVSPSGYITSSQIVYFKKNGITCDTEVVMGINSNYDLSHNIIIKPNPAR